MSENHENTHELPEFHPASSTARPGPEPQPPLSQTAPAVRQPRWSGRKSAVVAAVALGIASAGAITAAVAVPQGSIGGDSSGPGGHGVGPGAGSVPNQQQGGTPGQLPGPWGRNGTGSAANGSAANGGTGANNGTSGPGGAAGQLPGQIPNLPGSPGQPPAGGPNQASST